MEKNAQNEVDPKGDGNGDNPMFPQAYQAYAYPQKMRSTRDLMRRRNPLMRKRAELFAHI
ncbi:MAG: hypothetical protein SV375_04935 [Thermodesulfobacteriota bacterium]|nr:hypothetical protein [Thermodesulfobacteriota bacterium]